MTPTRGPVSSSSLRSKPLTGPKNSSPDSKPTGPAPSGKRSATPWSSESRDIVPQGYDAGMERRRVSSGSPYEAAIGFARAVRAGNHVLVSGTAPIWPDGSCDADAATQAQRCIEIIAAALAKAGAELKDVVRTRTYLTDPADADQV